MSFFKRFFASGSEAPRRPEQPPAPALAGYELGDTLQGNIAYDVWRASKDGDQFIVKMLNGWFCHYHQNSEKPLARDLQAAFAKQQGLSDSNIVYLTDHGVGQYLSSVRADQHWVARPYVPGRNLVGHRAGAAEAVSLARILVEALGRLDSQGLCHMRVKPENVILTPEGRPVLTDAGVPSFWSYGYIVALQDKFYPQPPFYGSPDREPTLKSTQFSLGLMVYEWLTGRPLYPVEDGMEWMMSQADPVSRRVEQANPEIPHSLSVVLNRMLQKDPAHRYPGTAELLADLDQAL